MDLTIPAADLALKAKAKHFAETVLFPQEEPLEHDGHLSDATKARLRQAVADNGFGGDGGGAAGAAVGTGPPFAGSTGPGGALTAGAAALSGARAGDGTVCRFARCSRMRRAFSSSSTRLPSANDRNMLIYPAASPPTATSTTSIAAPMTLSFPCCLPGRAFSRRDC